MKKRVAVIHEWLESYAGSERVLEQFFDIWPDADLYCVVDFLSETQREFLGGRLPKTSFIQCLPFARNHFRHYLPLMPFAMSRFDFSSYDLLISSSHAVAKAAKKTPGQLHACYCHTPMRYAWEMEEQYLSDANWNRGVKGLLARRSLKWLRKWDKRSAQDVDLFVANSTDVGHRIERYYDKKSFVIHPPVNTEYFEPGQRPREEFYVTASRLVPYKRIDLVIAAFLRMPQKSLFVIGDGPLAEQMKKVSPPNVHWLGFAKDGVLRDHMQRAKAFIFAGHEDFGIVMAEAQACGAPIIAFGKGGSCDIVCDGNTGLLFDQQTPESLVNAIAKFEQEGIALSGKEIQCEAERFSHDHFKRTFKLAIDGMIEENKHSTLSADAGTE